MHGVENSGIGGRVRQAITRAFGTSGPTDASIAEAVGMKPDAFSRAVNGTRQFSSLEIARLADHLDADVHWLITGEADPYRVVFAARHNWDPQSLRRVVPGREADQETLDALRLAYTQALVATGAAAEDSARNPGSRPDFWTGKEPVAPLPSSPAEIRALLGPDFVRTFADRVEDSLGIEVARIADLSTDYSFTIGGRKVAVLAATGNWFRSNFSLAHEIAHFALGHLDVTDANTAHERAADLFASELLLPEADMRAINWLTIDTEHLARFIWDAGVSTQAVAVRLSHLNIPASTNVHEALKLSTQALLRRHQHVTAEPVTIQPGATAASIIFATITDAITTRMQRAAERRIPSQLVTHHLDGIASGRLGKGTLAWLLNTPIEDLDVEEPQTQTASVTDLMADLGLTDDHAAN